MIRKLLLSGAVIIVGITFYFMQVNEPVAPEAEMDMRPGWQDQWLTMKENSGGEIPRGMMTQWHLYDNLQGAQKRRFNSAIKSVQFLGPNSVGGRTRDIQIDITNPDHMLACAISGGVWASQNAGKNWSPIDDLSPNLNVTCIDQSPVNPAMIYYGTGEARANSSGAPGEGVFLSTDTGRTFHQLPATLGISNMTSIWDIKCSSTDANTVYVACEAGGVWRSTDAGKSFQNVFSFNNEVHDLEVFPDGSIMVAAESSGIYLSNSGDSATYQKLQNGLPSSGFHRIEITYCSQYPDVVYAQFCRGGSRYDGESLGVWKSSNKGASWKPVGNPQDFGGQYTFPWYTLALQVSPKDTNFLISGSVRMHYSTDGGDSWRRAQNGHADNHVYAFNPKDPTIFFTGSDGGIHEFNVSNTNSRNTNRNNGYFATQFYAGGFTPDSLGIIGGTQDNGTHYQAEGGNDFKFVRGSDGGFSHIHQQNPDIAYVSRQNGNVERTSNINGISPSFSSIVSALDLNNDGSLDDGAWFITPYEMNYLEGDQLFLSTTKKVWASYTGGDTWKPLINNRLNPYCIGIPNEKEPSLIYIGGDGMLLLRVDDPKNSQQGEETNIRRNVPTGLTTSFIADIEVHPNDASVIFITLSDYSDEPRIWRIDDADTDEPKWTDISGNLPKGLPCNSIVAHPAYPDDAYVVATDFGLYSTTNGGRNWIKEDRIPNVAIHQIRLRTSDLKVFVYTHGRGAWALDIYANPDVGVDALEFKNLSVFPNPADQYLNITSEWTGAAEYCILNQTGHKIEVGKLQEQRVDIDHLPKGFYILTVNTENQKYIAPFLKI